MSIFEKAAPAVRKETKRVAVITLVCVLIMWAVFLVGHLIVPDKIPFDYRVILGGIGGGIVTGGQILAGAHSCAGEIGHVCVNRDETAPCSCGRAG